MSTPPTRRMWWSLALRVAGSVVVLAVLFQFLPVGELWHTMRRISPLAWLVVLAAYLGAHFIGVFKWRLMVNLAGAGLSLPQAARCYFAGLFGNIFLPSLIGGDVIRAGLALRMGRSKAGVLLGSLLDRILDIGALAIVAATGVLLVPGALDPAMARGVWKFLGQAALAGLLGLGLALLALWLLRRRFSFRMRRRVVKLRVAARSMARQPLRVGVALALGVTLQLSFVLLMSRIAIECGLFVPLRGWMFAYPLAKLAALAPITQGGIGVREAALAVLVTPFGAPPVLTVAAGLVWETVVITAGLLSGALAFWSVRASAAGAPVAATVRNRQGLR